MKTTTAECPYCGQIRTVMIPEDLEPEDEILEAQKEAIRTCKCMNGEGARRKAETLELATDHIEQILRESHPECANIFQRMKEDVYDGRIRKLTIDEGTGGKAIMKRTNAGISVSYEKKQKTALTT